MRRFPVSLCLLLGGLAVFVLGSPCDSAFPTNNSQVCFLVLTRSLLLGVVSAYVTFKTDNLLGAVLVHAGYDLTIIIPILNSR